MFNNMKSLLPEEAGKKFNVIDTYRSLHELANDSGLKFQYMAYRIDPDKTLGAAFVFEKGAEQVYFPCVGLTVATENGRNIFETILATYNLPRSVMEIAEPGRYRITRDGIKKTITVSMGESHTEVPIGVSQKDVAKVVKVIGEMLEKYTYKSLDEAIKGLDKKLAESVGVDSPTLFYVWTAVSKIGDIII
jgi:hypothetical protein